MFIVISYDIPDDKRRTKLATLMENYGHRVQYSVFECLLTEDQFRTLQRRMRPLLEMRGDRGRFYFLPRDAVKEIQVFGRGRVTEAPLFYDTPRRAPR